MQRGDIYYARLPHRAGSVQSGVRPVVIIQNNTGNYFSPTTIVCSITTKYKKMNIPTHLRVNKQVGGLKKYSVILCEQLFTINKADLIQYIGTIKNKRTIQELDECLRLSIGLSDTKETGEE